MRLKRLWPVLVLTTGLLLTLVLTQSSLSQTAKPANAVAAGAMSNSDVIALCGAGLSDDIVIAKIQAAPSTAFDTGVDGLKALRAANVPTAVIRAMINPHPAAASYGPVGAGPAAAPAGNPDDPNTPHPPGIYTLSKGADGQMHMVKLEAETPRAAKNSGMFLHAITQGIATSKTQQVLDGASATIELSQARPVFYAYIPENNQSFGGGMSVKDLVLTRLEVKGDTRLWTFASRGLIGGSSEIGSDEKDRQGFSSETMQPGIYKITPAIDLPGGQYAFKFLSSFFDFGVQPQA